VSGSYPENDPAGDAVEKAKIEAVARGVGKLLAERGYRIVSGFGLTVGSALLSGALEELYRDVAPNLERRLFLRPFTQIIPPDQDRQEFYRRYREDLVRQAGVCVFVGGIKVDGGSLCTAPGVIAEYEILRELGRIPMPVGATGGAAAEIWKLVNQDYEGALGSLPRALFDALNDSSATAAELVDTVASALEWLRNNVSR
jgi:hypothetical protein